MNKILNIIFVLILICTSSVAGITLTVIGELSLPIGNESLDPYHIKFPSLITKADTLILCSFHAIWKSDITNQSWIKVMDWPPDIYEYGGVEEVFSQLPPEAIAYIDSTITIMDSYSHNIFKLEKTSDDDGTLNLWRSSIKRKKNTFTYENFENFSTFKNKLLLGLGITPSDTDWNFIALQDIDDSSENYYKRIFQCPESLLTILTKNGIAYPYSIPAYNSGNNTIWVSVYGYEYIYIIDTCGVLLDSVFIDGTDYIKPSPLRSRIKLKVVWEDWVSRWTPLDNFNYAPPGFFILQYQTGFEIMENDSIPLFSTLAWDQNKQPVDINIDKRWQVAGVNPDGRLIFAHYLIYNGKRDVKIYITRIEQ